MKKILIFLVILFSVFTVVIPDTFSACNYTDWDDVWDALDWCLSDSNLVSWKKVEIKAWGWFQNQITQWTNNIALYLWIFAVGSIVFWGLMLVFSAWEEEKIKKAKDIVKWWIIWFVWIISASAIISIIVRIIYSL